MATWDISELGEEACSNCGAIYSVKFQELPTKDKDDFSCSCGNQLRSWKTTGMYMYELVQAGDQED